MTLSIVASLLATAGGVAPRAVAARALATPAPDARALPPLDREIPAGALGGDRPRFNRGTAPAVAAGSNKVTFHSSDGTTTERIYSTPVNFRDAAGNWRGIDTRVTTRKDGTLHNVAGPVDVAFAPHPSSDLVALNAGSSRLSFGLAGANAAATASSSDATVSYANVLTGTDLRYTVGSDRLKEELVLKQPPTSGTNSWDFPLSVTGVVPAPQADGAIVFHDAKGAVVFAVPRGVALDSSAKGVIGKLPATTPVQASVSHDAASWTITLSVDSGWLNDPARVYPVTVDPSYVFDAGLNPPSSDAFVANGAPDSNWNGSGQYDGTHYLDRSGLIWPGITYRSFMQYDVSSVTNKHILSAFWKGYFYDAVSYPSTLTLQPINAPAWDANTVTWNSQPSMRTNTRTASVTTANQWISKDVTTWVQFWNGTAGGSWANNGITTSGTPYFDMAAAEAPIDQRSYIEITYNSLPDVPTKFQLNSQSRTAINTTAPQLSAYVSDPDGGTLAGKFEIWDSTHTTLISSGTGTTVASGAPSVWTPPALSPGTYAWRAQGYDGTDTGSMAGFRPLIIDTTAPAAPGVTSSDQTLNTWNNTTANATFTLTNGGSSDVVAYYYGADQENPTKRTTSTTVALSSLPSGWRNVYFRSVDLAGNLSPVVGFGFGLGVGSVTQPTEGQRSQRRFVVQADGNTAYDGMALYYRRADTESFQLVPPSDVTVQSTGAAIGSWPVAMTTDASANRKLSSSLVWDAGTTLVGVDGPIQVRANYYISGTAQAAWTATSELVLDTESFGAGYAQVPVGPGSLNSVTGNFAVSANDVSLDGLGITRTFQSRDPDAAASVFGPGWTSTVAALDSSFTSLMVETNVVKVTQSDGSIHTFSVTSSGGYKPQAGDEALNLTRTGPRFDLIVGGAIDVGFEQPAGSTAYLPVDATSIGSQQNASIAWEVVGGVARPTTMVAPLPSGLSSCSTPVAGCRELTFAYATVTTASGTDEATWGDYAGRLRSVSYTAWDAELTPAPGMNTVAVASYIYDDTGQLRSEWDPRISPALKTKYSYNANRELSTITLPGQAPWALNYATVPGDSNPGRLASVQRSALPSGTATTTIAYQIPLTGAGAPYALGPADVVAWAQRDLPTDATAIFPPDQVPSGSPPVSYARATIYYTNVDGALVNVAAPGGDITTTEHDQFGNVVRELTAGNRQRVLTQAATQADRAVLATQLDTTRTYSDDGLDVTRRVAE